MFNFKFKKIAIPTGEQEEVTAFENWTVRWQSRYGEYSGNLRDEVEVFLTEKDATKFATQLREAFKLIRHTSNTRVTVEQTK